MARRGRINEAKHARWLQVLQQWQASGLSIRKFCREHGYHESQFGFWKRRLATKLDASAAVPKPSFLPVTVVNASAPISPAIDIRLASGHRLRVRSGCDRQLLVDVVAVLEGKSC